MSTVCGSFWMWFAAAVMWNLPGIINFKVKLLPEGARGPKLCSFLHWSSFLAQLHPL